MRVVLDTNILISSALGGALELILDKWSDDVFTVVVTSEILDEYFEVINRPKFRLGQETIDKIIRYIYQFAEIVVSAETIQVVLADPDDDKFLEAAIAGNVDAIVSGDAHLLELKTYRGIPILTAHDFIEQL